MASVLILSKDGDGVSLALRLTQEGNIVKMWVKEPKAKASLDGYKSPSKVSDPRKMLEQYDLVISDMVGMGTLCDQLKEKGKIVFGGGAFNDKLELDREYGLKVCKSLLKIDPPKSVALKTSKECLRYLETVTSPQVIKPLGNMPTNLTLVSIDGDNRTLKSFLQERGNELTPCIIQEQVDGIEISTEGWFNGREWVKPFNHTFEKKRFMEGDKGPNTGCMGNVVWTTKEDKLTKALLTPLAPLLSKVNYVGPLDVNCIVNQKECYFLEFTPRLGYDAIQALTELVRESLFDFLYKVATQQVDKINYYGDYGIAVRLSTTPWPGSDKVEELKGVQLLNISQEAQRHVWLSDVMKKDNVEVLAGVDGVLGCVSARGTTIRECKRRVYRTINNIVIHRDVQYRQDIGDDVEGDKGKLEEWGWLS